MFRDSKAFSGLAVDDLPAARAFYGTTLGLDVTEMNDGALLDIELAGGHHVLIYPKPDFEPATYTVLNFPVADVEGAVAKLGERGISMERYEGFDQDEAGIARGNGPDIAWFRDPAGNILAVMSDEDM